MLDSEITAPLDSTPAGVVHPPAWRLHLCMAPSSIWRLLLYKAPSSLGRALCKAPSSMALVLCKAPSPLAPALCKAPSPRHVRGGALHPTHGAPCAFSTKSQLPHERGVPKETLLPSSSRSCERPLSTPSALRLGPALKTPIWKSPETFGVTRSVRRTKPHTNTPPTAHSQRPARHLHRDPSISYYQRSASAHIATSPNATKPRRTAVRAARSRLLKAQLDTTCTSSKRAPGRSATAAISVTAGSTLDPWDQTDFLFL